jgi:hypothetical protein
MSKITQVYNNCLNSTDNNPYMNHIFIQDSFEIPCIVSNEEIENNFLNAKGSAASKIWYTVPVRSEFSEINVPEKLFGNLSICRDSGYTCKFNSEQFKNTDRIITSYDKKNLLYNTYK